MKGLHLIHPMKFMADEWMNSFIVKNLNQPILST